MKVYIGSDHKGYELKESIKGWLSEWQYLFEDLGAKKHDPKDDYPDFVSLVADKVARNLADSVGIVLGHSGQGEAIVANKFPGIRTAVYYGGDENIVKLSREHNDANILSLGASFLNKSASQEMVKTWLETKYSFEKRHSRRINKIKKLEKQRCEEIIVPAILTKDISELKQKFALLRSLVSCFQIDIMDNRFVPNKSIAVKDLYDLDLELDKEVHLMVQSPEQYFNDCYRANIRRVVIHFEAMKEPAQILDNMDRYPFDRAIALNPETKIEGIIPFLERVHAILFLSVHPGFQAQKFIPQVLEKVKELRKIAPNIKIGIDGGIEASNAKKALTAGADYLVIGSGLFDSANPEERYRGIKEAIK